MTDTPTHSGLILRSQLMEDLGIKDPRAITKLVRDGDLPQPSIGARRMMSWHVKVLERFYLERYELQLKLR